MHLKITILMVRYFDGLRFANLINCSNQPLMKKNTTHSLEFSNWLCPDPIWVSKLGGTLVLYTYCIVFFGGGGGVGSSKSQGHSNTFQLSSVIFKHSF